MREVWGEGGVGRLDCTVAVHDELVHATRTKGGGDGIHYHLTGIDVADYLGLPL